MNYLIDDVARTLAAPQPRRKALRLLGNALGGAFLAALGVRRANAALMVSQCTNPNGCPCGNSGKRCTNGQVMCGSSANCVCCSTVATCCGTNGQPVCCNPTKQCCSKSTSTCTASHGAC
jgi:hypothetical protein